MIVMIGCVNSWRIDRVVVRNVLIRVCVICRITISDVGKISDVGPNNPSPAVGFRAIASLTLREETTHTRGGQCIATKYCCAADQVARCHSNSAVCLADADGYVG